MKVVLAYSGGLDTSVAIPWLKERYDAQVITLTVNLGGGTSRNDVQERAMKAGATKALMVDGTEDFVKYFVFPALQAGAIYQGQYTLATALGRPLIARYLLNAAHKEGAEAVAHGCTGKGNDQVRFDLSIAGMDPSLRIIAPAREWNMTREEEIQYAKARNVPLELGRRSSYSVDENLWGRSIEAGDLEDPWQEPPEEAFSWTKSAQEAPDTPLYIEVHFNQGLPISLNDKDLDSVTLIRHLSNIAGEHGVGRVDIVENRFVGIKSRGVYETPGGTILYAALRDLEGVAMDKEVQRLRDMLSPKLAEIIYNGFWFSPEMEFLQAAIAKSQCRALRDALRGNGTL